MSRAVIFQVNSPFCLIEIADKPVRKMRGWRQRARNASEAGGVLLGTRRGPHFQIVVTIPQRGDARTRLSFTRRERSHRGLARRRWRLSRQQHGYLGEWHTHPENSPMPSLVDKLSWRTLFKQLHQPLIHIILGTEDTRLWYCDQNGNCHEAKLLT